MDNKELIGTMIGAGVAMYGLKLFSDAFGEKKRRKKKCR